jgi:putative endonuclease
MRQEKQYWVYIMASKPDGTLCTGVTGNVPKRAYEHKNNLLPGFTNRYGVPRLLG